MFQQAGTSLGGSVMSTAIQSQLVLLGCASCALAALLALVLLIPQWWARRTCLLFLKMQFCAATAASAGALLYADTLAVPLLQVSCMKSRLTTREYTRLTYTLTKLPFQVSLLYSLFMFSYCEF